MMETERLRIWFPPLTEVTNSYLPLKISSAGMSVNRCLIGVLRGFKILNARYNNLHVCVEMGQSSRIVCCFGVTNRVPLANALKL